MYYIIVSDIGRDVVCNHYSIMNVCTFPKMNLGN